MSNRMESSREKALEDKKKVKGKYHPPAPEKMKYKIIDTHLHSEMYFITKKKFNHKLKEIQKHPDFEKRFRIVIN